MTMKACFKCGAVRQLDEFYRHPRMADGHLNKCKDCTKLDALNRRLSKIDQIRAYDRERAHLPHRAELRRETLENWRSEHPARARAQAAVRRALSSGLLFREPCFVCGERAEAHHPDYDAPLAVTWLCRRHHMQAHALASHAPDKRRSSRRAANLE